MLITLSDIKRLPHQYLFDKIKTFLDLLEKYDEIIRFPDGSINLDIALKILHEIKNVFILRLAAGGGQPRNYVLVDDEIIISTSRIIKDILDYIPHVDEISKLIPRVWRFSEVEGMRENRLSELSELTGLDIREDRGLPIVFEDSKSPSSDFTVKIVMMRYPEDLKDEGRFKTRLLKVLPKAIKKVIEIEFGTEINRSRIPAALLDLIVFPYFLEIPAKSITLSNESYKNLFETLLTIIYNISRNLQEMIRIFTGSINFLSKFSNFTYEDFKLIVDENPIPYSTIIDYHYGKYPMIEITGIEDFIRQLISDLGELEAFKKIGVLLGSEITDSSEYLSKLKWNKVDRIRSTTVDIMVCLPHFEGTRVISIHRGHIIRTFFPGLVDSILDLISRYSRGEKIPKKMEKNLFGKRVSVNNEKLIIIPKLRRYDEAYNREIDVRSLLPMSKEVYEGIFNNLLDNKSIRTVKLLQKVEISRNGLGYINTSITVEINKLDLMVKNFIKTTTLLTSFGLSDLMSDPILNLISNLEGGGLEISTRYLGLSAEELLELDPTKEIRESYNKVTHLYVDIRFIVDKN